MGEVGGMIKRMNTKKKESASNDFAVECRYQSLTISNFHSNSRCFFLSSSTKLEMASYLPRASIPEGASSSWTVEVVSQNARLHISRDGGILTSLDVGGLVLGVGSITSLNRSLAP